MPSSWPDEQPQKRAPFLLLRQHRSPVLSRHKIIPGRVTRVGLARTPDFSRPPFTPPLGEAYCEGDQWRWRMPYLEVVNVQ